MKNKAERLKYLLDSDSWTEEDKIWLEQYLSGDIKALEDIAREDFQYGIQTGDPLMTEAESVELLKKLHERVGIKPAKIHTLWPRLIVAASLAVVVLGILFYNYTDQELSNGTKNKIVATHDLAPGKNSAVLTLSDGRVIPLSDSKSGVLLNASSLKYNDGSILRDSSKAGLSGIPGRNAQKSIATKEITAAGYTEKISISTPRAGTYQVTLPDGTDVWLNAATSLTYTRPLKSKGGIRKVELKGEAYFEVLKDKDHPFVVKSDKMELTVLGTHFNVNAYDDEISTKATLLEGSVRVASTFDEHSPLHHQGDNLNPKAIAIILKPSQQAIVNAKRGLVLKEVDANDAVAWKDGMFLFEDADLQTVMRQISRWYNLKVVYKGKIPHSTYNGKISRSLKLSKVLEVLKYYKVRFTLIGNTLVVEP